MRDAPRRITTLLANIIKFLLKDKTELVIFFTAFLVEMAFGFYLLYKWGHTFACGDAVSHLYIPRTVVDNGPYSALSNLGTVWLPMFHLLVVPLILIDPLYTTGLAGTIVNALATGGICVILCRLIGDKKLGILASVLFMCNAFTLIYGATAMTEQTAIFFTVLAVYYFKRYWEKDDIVEFMKCSLALILGTLTRYEAWAVALLVIFFFMLRELKNGQSYRIAYAHLPLWGIFAWVFWNLAILRDPLMFVHHPMSTQADAARISRFFAGSLWLTTDIVFQNIIIVSGALCLFAVPSLIALLIRKKLTQIMPAILLVSPIFFHWYLMFTQGTADWLRYFYTGFPGLVILSIMLARVFRKKPLKAIIMITVFVSYLSILSTQPVILMTGKATMGRSYDINFLKICELKEEAKAIKEVIGVQLALMSAAPGAPEAHSYAYYSVFTGSSPSLIIDDRDQQLYLEAMEKPWRYCSYVVMEKTGADDPTIKIMNDYFQGKYFLYRYHNDEAWRSEFLGHYEVALETKHYSLYQLSWSNEEGG